MREVISTGVGVVGATIFSLVGGWTAGLSTLILFMMIDYITGIIVAGVFKKSKKTSSGTLKSQVGFRGLCRKCMVLIYVIIAHRLDMLMDTTYIRDCVTIAFTTNELISITENAGAMGVPLPQKLKEAIDALTEGGNKNE